MFIQICTFNRAGKKRWKTKWKIKIGKIWKYNNNKQKKDEMLKGRKVSGR